MEEERRKVYVEVDVTHKTDGTARPRKIKFEDGEVYEIDRVRHCCRAASTKVGGTGLRYTVMICGTETFLFDEEGMKGKFEREKLAAKKIFGILDEPLSSEFYNLWIEFEEEETPDAIFACAIDRMMPFILNTYTSGKSWTEAGVTEKQVRNMLENAICRASDDMGDCFQLLMKKCFDEKKFS